MSSRTVPRIAALNALRTPRLECLRLARSQPQFPTSRTCALFTTTPTRRRAKIPSPDEVFGKDSKAQMRVRLETPEQAAKKREAQLREARMRRTGNSGNTAREASSSFTTYAVGEDDKTTAKAKEQIEAEEYKRRYNDAAGKWLRGMIALPIVIVLGAELFQRMVLGKEQKVIPRGEKVEQASEESEGG
ncbi:hypothetical protein F66182_2065 [Fusarium sp. NRRL 66182]|nr:hypothetical protein F66182_2065 [Fusarium sp. NRRL 66182]